MIVSFRHALVFVAIPKTGSQAVRRCLRPLLAANDWEQCVLLEQRFFPVAGLAAIGHGHIEWRELQPYLLGRLETMTSFAVVRDPYRRFVSLARFLYRAQRDLPDDYRDRLKTLLTDGQNRGEVMLREQHRFVCGADGQVRTRILRYEQLNADLDALGTELGLAIPPPPKVNVSPQGRPFEWDAELREMVRERYAEDFRLFAYDPEVAA